MANGESANERATVTMRVVSPCEHGVEHAIKEVMDGVLNFSIPECRYANGNPKNHEVTPEKYPKTVRRR